LNYEDITEIICRVSPGQMKRNFEPEQIKYTPPNGYSAITSIPYMVSAALVEGQLTLNEVTDEKVKDPRILKLAQTLRRSEDVLFVDYQDAAVEIRLRDGRVVKHAQTDAVGSPEIPASDEVVEAKFRKNSERWISPKNMDEIIDTVGNLEELDDVSMLMGLLQKIK
jgi:2-methylcitrate dehydratase